MPVATSPVDATALALIMANVRNAIDDAHTIVPPGDGTDLEHALATHAASLLHLVGHGAHVDPVADARTRTCEFWRGGTCDVMDQVHALIASRAPLFARAEHE